MFKGIKVNKNTIVALYKITNNHNTSIFNISYINNGITTNICPSGSIKSAGGEYRNGILNWLNFNTFLNKPANLHIKEIYDEIQAYLKASLIERKLDFTVEYPNFVGKLDVPIDYIKIFSIAWFNFYYELALNLRSNKLNTEFDQIMKIYIKEDLSFFKSIIIKFKQDVVIFRNVCTNISNSDKIGQKITILYELEIENMHDIKYDIWKEIAVNERVSKLVTDNVTNGFPLIGPHFLIKTNEVIKLFDNKDQYKKIEQSKIAIVVRDLLEKAMYALNTSKSEKQKNKKRKENINKFINFTATNDSIYNYTADEFWLLRNNIHYNKNHAENFITSNTALNMISEHSGKTIYDICDINGGEFFAESQFANFNKYMFELCYNLYCLNTKIHCIHRDLHLNNITISMSVNDKVKLEDITDSKILFIVGKQKFIFANNFHNLCLIDFNSAIINPELFLEKSNIDTSILDIQINNLLYYLYSVKPEYEEYDQFLKGNAKYDFDTYFKILSALDLYNICAKLLSFLKLNKKKLKRVNVSKSKLLLEAILKLADYYLTDVFDEMINAKDNAKFKQMEWPILSIINNIFAENLYKSGDEIATVDTFGG
jgi:hypothetical protein